MVKQSWISPLYIVALACMLASCSDTNSSPTGSAEEPTTATVQKRLIGSDTIPPGITLAEGVDADPLVDAGTGNQCISHSPSLTLPNIRQSLSAHDQLDEAKYNTPFHRFFWMNDYEDVDRMTTIMSEAENGDALLDFHGFKEVADHHFRLVFGETEGPVLSALVVIPSSDWNAENPGQASSPDNCVTSGGNPISPQPSSLSEWVDDCGVRFLEEEKRGYYFFISAYIDQVEETFGNEPEQGWANLVRLFQIENYDNQTDSVSRFEDVAALYPDIQFFVTGHTELFGGGPDYPQWLYNQGLFMSVDQYREGFVEYYQGEASDAVQQEDFEQLGTPIWQLTPVYDAALHLEEICGIQQTDIEQAFGCYQYFEEQVRIIEERIRPQVGIYVDAIQNPTEYIQPNDSKDWERFLKFSWDPLINDLPNMKADCANALASGNVNDICSDCSVEPIRDVIRDFGSLTKPRPAISAAHPTAFGVNYSDYTLTANQNPKTTPITQEFCGLHWVSGKFAGGAEAVVMSRNGSDWALEAVSNQTASSERIRARMTCTDSITKDGNCGGSGTFCHWYEKCDNGTCVTDPYYAGELETTSLSVNNGNSTTSKTPPQNVSPPLSDKPYLAMFSGISGKMSGLGEEATVSQYAPSAAAELNVQSAQGYLEGWSTGALVTSALSSSHYFYDIGQASGAQYDATVDTVTASAEETVEVSLAPANQAFCYMMSAGGEFDGAGENVRLVRKSGVWVAQARSVGTEDCGCGVWACGCDFAKEVRTRIRCINFSQ